MSDATDRTEDPKDVTWRAVAGVVAGAGLQVRELANELVISNPRDPDLGQVHVEYAGGHVSWRQMTWDYWGTLEGFRDVGEGLVSGEKILDTLLGRG